MKKFPFYRQQNVNDCGPSCLYMICSYYRNKYPIKILRDYCHITRAGVTIRDITDALNKLEFKNIVVNITFDEVLKMPTPAILYWQQKHFVVLFDVVKSKNKYLYCIADPDYGKIKLEKEEFYSGFCTNIGCGIGIVIEPTLSFYDVKGQSESIFQIISKPLSIIANIFYTHRKGFLLSIVFTLIALMANWTIPILFQHIIDDGIEEKKINIVYLLAMCQMILFISYVISYCYSNIFLTKNSYKIGIKFLSEYLQKLIKLPIYFFDSKANSDLIQLVDDQENLKSFLSYDFIAAFLALCNLMVFSIIVLCYNYNVFFIFMCFASLSIVWSILFLKKKRSINYRRFSLYSEGKSHIYELIMGMREIKINSAQEKKVIEVCQIQDKINEFQLKDLYLNYFSNIGVTSFNKIKDILIIIFCANLVIQDKLSIGTLMTISYLLGQISMPLEQLLAFVISAQDAKLSFDRLQEVQTISNENSDRILIPPISYKEGIKLKDVWFKYIGSYSPYILKNISLNIPQGKITAIVGTSGSGKTSLLKLLLNFYNPTKGFVFLDDIDITKINPEEWRERCGVVMQDGYLFSSTIFNNIAIADKEPDMSRAINAAKMACIHDFINGLPLKYDTNIGNTGIDLSGGQRQRLLIARAIYKNPDFMFLDEATSFLDASNEVQIMTNLNNFFVGKTVVIVAHRLSTVKNANNIIVLENGEVAEQGTHEDLISTHGKYYQLIKNQLELGK